MLLASHGRKPGWFRQRGVALPEGLGFRLKSTPTLTHKNLPMGKQLNVAIIGLGFGAEFIPIYQRHPDANMYAICQRNAEKLNEIGDAFGVEKRYTDYDELLKDPNID